MEFFIFLFIASIVLGIWCATRTAKLSGTEAKVDQLGRELDRLSDRVVSLEKDLGKRPTLNHAQQSIQASATDELRSEAVKTGPVSKPLPTQQATVLAKPLPPPLPAPQKPVAGPSIEHSQPLGTVGMRGVEPKREPVAPSPVKAAVSLEERLGQNWLNKLGIVALVTGLALLFGYQLRNLGPVGKSIAGSVISATILVTGILLERSERYRIFARATIGGGWALLFFVAYAIFHVPAMQVLHSQASDLAIMLAVAAAMVIHSLRYRSQVVTSLAFLLGFFTVAISHTTLFSLVAGAILAVGLLAVAFRQRWFVLPLGGLIAVYLNHALWLRGILPDGASPSHLFTEFVPSAALLLFYWFIFRVFFIFRVPETNLDRICSTLNALLNSIALLSLLKYQSTHPEWAFRGLLALGTVELLFAFVARRRHHRAFVALACIASLFLLSAIPFHFAGMSWSLAWLLESEVLFIVGLALRESVFRRLGIVSGLATIVQLIATQAVPIFDQRQLAPDASHHVATALTLIIAAATAWINAEYVTRRFPDLVGAGLERVALRILSYSGALCCGLSAWLAFAGPWTVLPWLLTALMLAAVAGLLRSEDLALQADLFSLAALIRIAYINFSQWDQLANSPRVLIMLLAGALFYVNVWRRQSSYVLSETNIASAYAWSATGVYSVLAWYALQPSAVAVAWCLMAAVLLEVGLAKSKPFLRHQAYVLLATSFVRLFYINIAASSGSRIYTMLQVAALFAWSYHRLHSTKPVSRLDRLAGDTNSWFSLGTVTALLYFSTRPAWIAAAGAALAISVLILAQLLKRSLFRSQAVVLILFAGARTLAFNVLRRSHLEQVSSQVGSSQLLFPAFCSSLHYQ